MAIAAKQNSAPPGRKRGAMRAGRATITVTPVLKLTLPVKLNGAGTTRRSLNFTLAGCFLLFFVTQLYFINKRTTLFK